MITALKTSLRLYLLLTLLTGVAYPALVTASGGLLFPRTARGSLVRDGSGTIVGSALIGQPWNDPRYFWGRPSATGGSPYNPLPSSGSNYGPSNPALLEAARARIDALLLADPGNRAKIPVDLVTASASGLDPHISPAAAEYQVERVARARWLDPHRVRALVREHVEGRSMGVIGEPRINLLALNRALDQLRADGRDTPRP